MYVDKVCALPGITTDKAVFERHAFSKMITDIPSSKIAQQTYYILGYTYMYVYESRSRCAGNSGTHCYNWPLKIGEYD